MSLALTRVKLVRVWLDPRWTWNHGMTWSAKVGLIGRLGLYSGFLKTRVCPGNLVIWEGWCLGSFPWLAW